jgi:hypothetical protein
MIYLASPYNHRDKAVIQARMEQIYAVIGKYTKEGTHVITPLFMHEVVIRHDIAGDYMFWEAYCLNLLKRCDKMIVLCLYGWDTSRGVTAEIEFCKANGTGTVRSHNWTTGGSEIRECWSCRPVVQKVKVRIIESERGWGQKVDEVKEFDTREEASDFCGTFNLRNDQISVPDWYMYAEIDE